MDSVTAGSIIYLAFVYMENGIYAPDFGGALAALKAGLKVTRAGWNGKGMWLMLETPDTASINLPYIMLSTADVKLVPWTASQTDVLAEDWAVVADEVASTSGDDATASNTGKPAEDDEESTDTE